MSTLIDTVASARSIDGYIVVTLTGGHEIRFLAADNPRLRGASDQELNGIEISPFGVHWPALDEDLSVRGLLAGDFGQHQELARNTSLREPF